MTGHWSLFVDPPRPGWENMAIDAALLDWADSENGASLRLYRWEPYCLSFGRHEPATRRYDAERIRTLGLDCVRRPTGGRAVWHARELTYAVAAPLDGFGGLKAAYHAIHEVLAAALRRLGATPLLAPRHTLVPAVHAGPCFAAPVGGEVLVDGRKVAGSAQLRQGDAFLQHGSLLLDDDQGLVRALAGLPDTDTADAPLSRLLGRPVGFEEAAASVAQSAADAWPGLTPVGELPEPVRAGASRHAARFQSPEWTWLR